ncbi:LysR family transcriptional regulator [Luteipulveratus sp. YIM 133132]|uniref:LysR family transcriptional regulator n=1 Tax=Luteipulveratus flavus TaxID=3031728 RepID=UPI0023B01B33|nr:LysR family transcriptional regulator [Luteipulveratus sp. YIM 133132]MDE9365433.1 LysR family transcriptional regulator [Luteipulveratus sp. YIM 133132]
MNVDAGLLRSFLVVADEGTVTGAAERLFISQPALSGQVRRLERIVGLTLFERHPGGVRLTPAGATFLPYAEQVLATLERGVADAAAAAGQGTLRLDVLDASLAVPQRVIDRLRQRLPSVVLEITDRGSGEQAVRLRGGTLDLALTAAGRTPTGMTDTPLVAEPLGVAVAGTHRLATAGDVRLAQLADEVHYLPREEFAPEWVALVTAACEQAGFTPRLLPLRSESTDAPMHRVAAGECVAVSLLSTTVPPGVVMCPLADAPAYRWVARTSERHGALVGSATEALRGMV